MNKAMGKWMGVLLSVLILVSIIPINLVSAAQSDIRINENSRFAETKLVSTVYNLSNKEKGSILEGVILEIIGQSEDQVFFYLNDELLYLNIDTVEFLNSDYVPAYEDVENESLNKTDMMFETTEEVKIYADGKFEKTVATIYANQEFSGFMDENNIIHIRFSDKMGYIPGLDGVVEQSEEVNVNVVETEEVQEPVDENGTSQENIIQEDVHTEINMPESASYVGSVARFTTNNLPLVEERIFTKPFFEVIENNVPIYDNSTGKLVQVGSLTKGQTFPIVSDYGDWHQVKYGNGYGYVWKDATEPSDGTFLKNLNNGEKNSSSQIIATSALAVYDNTSGQLVQYGTILKGQSYPIIANMGAWLKIDFAGRIGYVYEPATKRPFKATDSFFEAIENNIAIYDNGTGKLVQVGSLTQGQVYPIVSDYGDWHQVKYGNGYGYVWKDATKPSDGQSLKNLNNGEKNSSSQIIATSALAVYDNTSGQLVQYGTILKGQSYPIIANMGTWLKIDFAGRIGYVYEPATKRPFKNTDSFFEAIENNIAIYDNSTGKLVQVGSLVKGQEYPISAHYGDWHQIKFGRGYAYVWKDATKPANGSSIKNENKNELLSKWNFTSQESVAVYDNTSGSLVPFAVLNEGVTYPYISTYGTDWLKIDVSGRIGYVFKTAVQQNHSYQYTSYSITLQEMVDKQFSAGAQTDNKYDTYVREDALILNSAKTSGTANGSWNVRGGAGTNYWIVGTINNGEIVKILGQVIGADGYTWYKINYNQTWVNASSKDIEYYVNPLNFSRDTSAYYQFLDLSKVAGVTATEVNQKILYNKGIFINEAQSFITAASTYNVNEIYLISHALLETGNGKSTLATGVMVSTVNGKPVEPKTVYNVYGIGALDRCPLTCGAEYAYDQNWFTPEAAIIGGAKFIAERYINHATYKQNTLYKMRWNPTQPGSHQYATDIGWAYKQVSTISNLYNLIDKYTLQFDVPQYK